MTESMDSDADEELIDIEERPTNDLEITIPVTTLRAGLILMLRSPTLMTRQDSYTCLI